MDIEQYRPRFRTDLVAKPLDDAGERFVDVVDPGSGKTFRFYDVEYSIACAMDGNRDISGLIDWAAASLGLETTPEELKTVISTLEDLGYLDSAHSDTMQSDLVGADIDLGVAGFAGGGGQDEPLPVPEGIELGTAGGSRSSREGREVLPAADISLGESGNETLPSESGGLFAQFPPIDGSADADEDDSPTTIKPAPEMPQARDVRDDVGDMAVDDLVAEAGNSAAETTVHAVLQPASRGFGTQTTPDSSEFRGLPQSDFDEAEVSVDLTEHMRLGAADVKEAVRQSRVMPSLNESQVGADPYLPTAAGSDTAQRRLDSGVDSIGDEATNIQAPQSMPQYPDPSEALTELPEPPAAVANSVGTARELSSAPSPEDEMTTEVGRRTSSNSSSLGWLLVFLLLLVVIAGGAYWWFFMGPGAQVQTQGDEQASANSATSAAAIDPNAAAVEEVEPPPPTATLEERPAAEIEVLAQQEGTIAEIVATGTSVEEGDIVVKLAGYQRHEPQIAKDEYDVKRYETRIAETEAKLQAAQERDDDSAIKRYERNIERDRKKISDRQARIDKERKAMEPYFIYAPVSGEVKTELEVKGKVAAEEAVFSLQPPSSLQATFERGDAMNDLEAGGTVNLIHSDDAEHNAECIVTDVSDASVIVGCSSSVPFELGDTVILDLAQ